MAYAYLDKYGVLHVVGDEKTAQEFTGGKVVETDIENTGGYPVVDGQTVVYEDGKAFVDGNIRNGRQISVPAAIQNILDELK